jgi:hypothetical protein
MHTLPRWLAPLLLLLGCAVEGEKTYKTLAELKKPELFMVPEGGKPMLRLYTDYQQGCPAFAGTARMNGTTLPMVSSGGTYEGFSCIYPTWSLPTPLPAEGVTELAIEDETGSLRMGLYNLGAKRGVKYRAPTTSSLHWGQLVEVEVIPNTDYVSWALPGSIDMGNGVLLQWSIHKDNIDRAGAEEGILRFRLPEQPPEGAPSVIRGAALVFASYNEVHPGIAYCHPSPDQCLAKLWLPLETELKLPISIE